jgi:hypothetical protein
VNDRVSEMDEELDNIPKAISEATLNIMGTEVRCYVLDNGERIFNADDVEKLFNEAAGDMTIDEAMKLSLFINGK